VNAQKAEVAIWKVEDVMALLGKKKSWIYDHARTGEIPSFKLPGGAIRFSREDVLAWLEGLKRKPAALFSLAGRGE
jgi:excisionase family DNA binding protein